MVRSGAEQHKRADVFVWRSVSVWRQGLTNCGHFNKAAKL